MDKCKYCNENMSFGNNSILNCDESEIYIAHGILKLQLDKIKTISRPINYCPMCGRKLYETQR